MVSMTRDKVDEGIAAKMMFLLLLPPFDYDTHLWRLAEENGLCLCEYDAR